MQIAFDGVLTDNVEFHQYFGRYGEFNRVRSKSPRRARKEAVDMAIGNKIPSD